MVKLTLKFLLLFLFIAYHVNGQNYIYVSGSNTVNGNGTLSNPFKTINLAVAAAASGDTIVIRQGIYREQVSLSKGNLNFVPYSGEQVSINGSDPLLTWTNLTGSVYQTVMNWNVTESDQSNQIFYKGQMLDLVRWPVNSGTRILPTNAHAENVTSEGGNFVFYDADFQDPAGKWNGCEIWVNLSRTHADNYFGLDGQGWTGRIISSEPGKIIVQGTISGKIGDEPWGLGPNTEYFLFNPTATSVAASGGIQNYLQAGQWWKNGNTLYVRTTDNAAPSSTLDGTNLVEAKRRLYSFSFSDKSNILIKGLNTFACAINTDVSGFWNRTSSVSSSSNVTIDGIKAQYVTHFTNQAGQYQMQWLQRSGFILSGTNIILKNSEIQYSAGSAVSVFGRRNKILNNKIWDVNYSSSECGAMNTGRQYDPGLVINEDSEIAYNSIYNTPQQGINIRAMINSSLANPGVARIHHNVIHDFMLKTHDSGAIDTYNSNGNGVRVDHNIIYNGHGYLVIGFYLDFGTNYIIDHNLIFDVQWPILTNFGGWGLFTPSDLWIFNNTALADVYGKPGIANGARDPYDYSDGSNVINNITSASIPNSAASPYVKNNFSVINATQINASFTNSSGLDYTLKASASKFIDVCDDGPFNLNDQIVNKVDAGCYEYGVTPWVAGYRDYYATNKDVNVAIRNTSLAPVIDGLKEATWNGTVSGIDNIALGGVSSATDLSATWTALWDNANLYLFVSVKDESIKAESGTAWWDDDRLEIFIDAAFSRSTTYGAKQYQYYVRPGETTLQEVKLNAVANTHTSYNAVTGGYDYEIKIPFATLGITPSLNLKLGIDIQVGDDDDGGGLDAKMAWYATADNTWQDPSLMGIAKLGADVTGINQNFINKSIAIYPNPAKDKLTVSNVSAGSVISVIRVDGRIISTQRVNDVTIDYDVSSWNKGIYLFKIQEGENFTIKRAIIF